MQGFTPVHNDSIALPDGRMLNVIEAQAARVVEEYSSDLVLGQLHGQWTVFVRSGPIEGQPFPVLGLGHELPSPDLIQKRLHTSDTKRHGGKIAERVERQNREHQRQIRARADQGVAETAEHLEFAYRKLGKRPAVRIFVPGKD